MPQESVIAERFRLLGVKRELRASTVYTARELTTGQKFTVYLLRQPLCKDGYAQAQLLRSLKAFKGITHPNLARAYALGETNGYCYIIYEDVEGFTLAEVLRREGPPPIETALDIALQICEGMNALHQAGLANGGLPLDEVILTQSQRIKILGVGLPSAIYGLGTPYRIWLDPLYLAPEQLRGAAITPAADVYSIGLILYQLLCGSYPFHKNDSLRQTIPPVRAFNPQVPPELEEIVQLALNPEPSLRYRNAHQLGYLLKAQLEKLGPAEAVPYYPAAETAEVVAGEEVEEEHIDWLALILGAIALLAVAGMVILWTIVYHRYAGLM